jgi:hypothetical protein
MESVRALKDPPEVKRGSEVDGNWRLEELMLTETLATSPVVLKASILVVAA